MVVAIISSWFQHGVVVEHIKDSLSDGMHVKSIRISYRPDSCVVQRAAVYSS